MGSKGTRKKSKKRGKQVTLYLLPEQDQYLTAEYQTYCTNAPVPTSKSAYLIARLLGKIELTEDPESE